MKTDLQLQCPLTKQRLTIVSLAEARTRISAGQPLVSRVKTKDHPEPVGETPFVQLRQDHRAAYPIVDNIPVLLSPEVLSSAADICTFDLKNSHYAEAYSESYFYNKSALADAEAIRVSRSVANIDSES